jgi:lipopolysaccharide/colanic/teichoic acid biosynthesis glycosyltransferase
MNALGRQMKRAMDLVLVFLLLLPASVLMAIVAVAIKLDSRGPVIYASERIGRGGEPFTMFKFRSMVVGAEDGKDDLLHLNEVEGPVFKVRDDPRVTRVGRHIRRLSLDELPQLFNVLMGDMSLVGPRPPLASEVADYQPWQMQRLTVTGGLTGLWQISGRSDLDFDDLCRLDIEYIETWSLLLDVQILLKTIPAAVSARGAY